MGGLSLPRVQFCERAAGPPGVRPGAQAQLSGSKSPSGDLVPSRKSPALVVHKGRRKTFGFRAAVGAQDKMSQQT